MLIYSGFPPKMCWVWHKNLLSTELFFVSPRPGRMCKFHESLMGLRNFRKIFSGKISGGVKGLLCSLPRVCHWPGLLLLAQPRSQPIPGLCGRRCCVSWSWLSLPPSNRAPVGELGSPPVPEEQLLPWVALPGIPWHPQKFPGIPWHSLEFPGIPWNSLAFPGISWYSQAFPGSANVPFRTHLLLAAPVKDKAQGFFPRWHPRGWQKICNPHQCIPGDAQRPCWGSWAVQAAPAGVAIS